ncbi:MAG: glycosyltransferase family 4 protein [Actinobacteria bacterium]|nr:glycosyltransferase family 4 protein [Actinomycetota bacterium]
MTADAVGGVWTYALELVDALAEHDVHVTLAVMGSPRPDQRAELAASRVDRAFTGDYALEWMDHPWDDVRRAGEWLLEMATEVEPDLVHLNGYAHASLPWEAPVIVVGHSDVLSWHQAVRGKPAGDEWARYREVVESALSAADLLVAPTRAMLDELIRLYEPACPRRVVPNGSSRTFPQRPREEVILTAGRLWDQAKNVQALVRVAPRLSWPVDVVGAGEVDGDVRFLGRLDRGALDLALATASVFCGPARYEPFGLAALEAARAGCALVLGDIPSLREVWGDAAVFVAADDDARLARALQSVIDDRDLRAEYAGRALRRARRYSTARMAAGYLEAYGSVLHRDRLGAT